MGKGDFLGEVRQDCGEGPPKGEGHGQVEQGPGPQRLRPGLGGGGLEGFLYPFSEWSRGEINQLNEKSVS